MNSSLNILFMGSASFAVPALDALLHSAHHIVGAVTQPDKPAGRGMHLTACPVAQVARDAGLLILQPATLKDTAAVDAIAALHPDLIVVVAYGKLLPRRLLDLPRLGCVNLHSSLLPKYRGAAPINWAILNGETETGVTTMYLNEQMDAGDIIHTCATDIDPCETAGQLHDRLSELGADLLLETVTAIARGDAPRTPQNHARATLAPMLRKEDGHIDWTLPANVLYNRIRGLHPWPGSFTFLGNMRLRILEVAPMNAPCTEPPGTVIAGKHDLSVATGEGLLYLMEVQPEGKAPMSIDAFLRGHPISPGTKLT